MTELERYKLAYNIMLCSHGDVDSEDCVEIARAVVAGAEVDWNKYPSHTVDELKPLFDGVSK